MSCCATSVQIWPQHSELLCSEMEEDSSLKLAFETGPTAPDVPALPAEPACDPCQRCGCQRESAPATGSRSAKAFSCVRKRSKLPSSICLWMESMPPCGSIKTQESLEPSQALTLSSGSNIWKLVAKSQTVLRSLVRTGLWYIHYREGSIQYWHMNWGSYTANWHISLHK